MEATALFDSIGHSDRAVEIMQELQIGIVKPHARL
jgi:hypothetical protein